jgi:hypothetical protein
MGAARGGPGGQDAAAGRSQPRGRGWADRRGRPRGLRGSSSRMSPFGPGAWDNELPPESRAIFVQNAPTFLDELRGPGPVQHRGGSDLTPGAPYERLRGPADLRARDDLIPRELSPRTSSVVRVLLRWTNLGSDGGAPGPPTRASGGIGPRAGGGDAEYVLRHAKSPSNRMDKVVVEPQLPLLGHPRRRHGDERTPARGANVLGPRVAGPRTTKSACLNARA